MITLWTCQAITESWKWTQEYLYASIAFKNFTTIYVYISAASIRIYWVKLNSYFHVALSVTYLRKFNIKISISTIIKYVLLGLKSQTYINIENVGLHALFGNAILFLLTVIELCLTIFFKFDNLKVLL